MSTNKMRPIHPGELLRDEMNELAMSARALAEALSVPPNRITAILNQRRGISADTALRLARYFGTSPEFWMNIQAAHDLRQAAQESSDRIQREVHPRAG